MLRELPLKPAPGLLVVGGLIVAVLADLGLLIAGAVLEAPPIAVVAALLMPLLLFLFRGVFALQPNEAAVATLFGTYVGSVRDSGLWWMNPFTTRRKISLRTRNLETTRLKVNDARANPIEIAAIVVWKVADTAEACFEVDDFERYVTIQSEAAARTLASSYPYDAHTPEEEALSTHTAAVSAGLHAAVVERLAKAGVEVVEARISHLAYAPEIAAAMLQRQQASAVVAARREIVAGAVGMVESALALLSEKQIVNLDDERRAAMVSNLLVVLCSDRAATPVVNTGTLYT